MPANLENSAVATGPLWKRSAFIPIPKKGNAKECSNYHIIVLISHASKVMLEILQARLQQYVNQELPDVQAGFRKRRGTRDQIVDIEKTRQLQKNFSFIDYAKAFDCVSSVAQSCPTLCTPWTATGQASLSITNSWSPPKPMSIDCVSHWLCG